MPEELRIDDLAREAGVATTTVRLYQSKSLLPPPRLEGRTGWYGPHHLSRLRLIGRLQDDGFSLAAIGRLLEEWERGRSLGDIFGVEAQLDVLIGGRHATVLDARDVVSLFPEGAMTPALVQRASQLGLFEVTDDGRFRLPDRRFVDTGAALAHLGVPLDAVLDEWAALVDQTDEIANRFVRLFEEHLLPDGWQSELASNDAGALATSLARLQSVAHEVLAAALDSSLARVGRGRIQDLLPDAHPQDG